MRFHPIVWVVVVFFALCAHAQPKVVINELMYAPKAPEPEWVELFNYGTDTVSLGGWKLSDAVRTVRLPHSILEAGHYCIITKDSTTLRSTYPTIDCPVLQVSLPSYNNTGDKITLYDSLGTTLIDSFDYTPLWGGSDGRSIERFDVNAPSDSSNFFECIDSSHGTPGAPNSVRRRDLDASATNILLLSQHGTTATLGLVIRNRGRASATNIGYSLYRSGGVLPLITGTDVKTISPLEYDTILFDWEDCDLGPADLVLAISLNGDELIANDTVSARLVIPIPPHSIVINELMITPHTGLCQWIELYNQTESRCSFDGASLGVSGVDTEYRFKIGSLQLAPKGFAVISSSTHFSDQTLSSNGNIDTLHVSTLKLNSSGNSVRCNNIDGSTIDSIAFDPSFYTSTLSSLSGISLERKHPDGSGTNSSNWGSCYATNGSTPLAPNSVSSDSVSYLSGLHITISPNPISPDGDGIDDNSEITVQASGSDEKVLTVGIYDSRGVLRRTITTTTRMVSEATLSFDGYDDHGAKLGIGLYTVIASTSTASVRTGLVVMYKTR